jgi:hypothetical protein
VVTPNGLLGDNSGASHAQPEAYATAALYEMMPRLLSCSLLALLTSAASLTLGNAASFSTDVMQALSKAGCNLGTCHGNATGKGGFKLSLRGQDMALDHAALALEADGRRINPVQPEQSLLLLKATNALAHEGGKRFDTKSWEYAALRDWIQAGAPAAEKDAPRVKSISVSPPGGTFDHKTTAVQLKVRATFSDGSQRDVTGEAVYEPLQLGMVEVSATGRVQRLQYGEPSVLVRYLSQSQPVRFQFVQEKADFVWAKPRRGNYVDAHVFKKLHDMKINPSGLCGDGVFVRRAYLDLLGIIPTAQELKDFSDNKNPAKRAMLVDALMARPEFADFWSMKWADLLKVESRTLDKTGMVAFHSWIRGHVARNTPLDQFTRELIAARGSSYSQPAANYYRANRDPVTRAVSTAQVFLGTRLQCAQCHNHPFDRWTQDDYYNWVALFARIDYQLPNDGKRADKNDKHSFIGEQVIFLRPKEKTEQVENPRTGDTAKPRFLCADLWEIKGQDDELQAAARWITSPQNKLFSQNMANRIWFHLMGRGLVDPVDDFRLTNPATHPALLEALAEDLVKSGYDMRHLIRTIMLSRSYQLSSEPNETNEEDGTLYSHVLPRRLTAEQLFDSLHLAFGVPSRFTGEDRVQRASQRAEPTNGKLGVNKLRPESPEAFLAQFGKPARQIVCECERSSGTSLSQTFQLISGPLLNDLVRSRYSYIHYLPDYAKDSRDMVTQLYTRFLSRDPSAEELKTFTALLEKTQDKRSVLQDLAWSLANAKGFVLRP